MADKQEKNKKDLIEILQSNPVISHACKKLNLSRPTFYRWIKDDPIFTKTIEDSQKIGQAVMCDAAESKIMNLLNSNNEDIVLKAGKTILTTYHTAYKNSNEGVNHQKAILRNEIEKLKKEKYELVNSDHQALREILEILKNDPDLEIKPYGDVDPYDSLPDNEIEEWMKTKSRQEEIGKVE